MKLQIGVFTPGGGFEAHKKALDDAYEDATPVQDATDLAALDGLIISGSDARILLELLQAASLFDQVRELGRRKPIIATGAAACLLAREVKSPVQESLDLVNIGIECGGYEHQIDSQTELLRHEFDDESGALQAVFLRPPIIRWMGAETKVIAKHNNDPVLVEQGIHMVATFHPELSSDRRVYAYFLDKVRDSHWNLHRL